MSASSAGASAPLVRVQKMAIVKLGSLPALPKKALAMIKAQFAKNLPKGMSAAQRARAIRLFELRLAQAPKPVHRAAG